MGRPVPGPSVLTQGSKGPEVTKPHEAAFLKGEALAESAAGDRPQCGLGQSKPECPEERELTLLPEPCRAVNCLLF